VVEPVMALHPVPGVNPVECGELAEFGLRLVKFVAFAGKSNFEPETLELRPVQQLRDLVTYKEAFLAEATNLNMLFYLLDQDDDTSASMVPNLILSRACILQPSLVPDRSDDLRPRGTGVTPDSENREDSWSE